MIQKDMFGKATWVGSSAYKTEKIFILRGKFNIQKAKKATLRVLGLGIFHCYINGKRVSDDLFLPLNSEFEPRNNFPIGEELSGFRIYVPEYDVTNMLNDGENVIAIHFGAGWYTYERECMFGYAKAIWRIFGVDSTGEFDFYSSINDKIASSFIYDFTVPLAVDAPVERQDCNHPNIDALNYDYDDSTWNNAVLAVEPITKYEFSNCPADKICEILTPTKIFDDGQKKVYDASKNTSGYISFTTCGEKGDQITVIFSEERLENGELDPKYSHKQEFSCVCDGNKKTVHPLFTWYGFRYFEIVGRVENIEVNVIHTDLKVTSSFDSDNETLNWIYKAFVNTELTNLHTGMPSDCPHIERRGYTGDGQVTSHAAMTVLDAEKLYRKWMQDIADSQDKISGHVQNTAPYTHAGGGPGGFSGAIVEIPYQFYRHYGDISVLEKYYPNMLRYFDYLDAHSECDLVVSDKKGEWCLGDWPISTEIILPLPFVNTYFYVKYLYRAIRIAKLIGKESDIPTFEEKIENKKKALVRSYFNYNPEDSNFFGCRQGANAYMIDIGLGAKRTYPNMIKYYERIGEYDTGIFGTEVLTRILFENGNADLAVKLLTSESTHSFYEMKKRNATTLWEYIPGSLKDRSHNHPMFGSVTAFLFDYILGIREADDSLTYNKIKIAPMLVEKINRASGHRRLPAGDVFVAYEKDSTSVSFKIVLPKDIEASFVYNENVYNLSAGENKFKFNLI